MLDIQFIRDNPDLVQQKSDDKKVDVDIKSLLAVDEKRRELIAKVDELRADRNKLAESMKAGKPSQEQIEKGRSLKEKTSKLEAELAAVESEFEAAMKQVPNPAADDVPVGDEHASAEISKYGSQETGAKDHLEFAEERGWVDFERGAKVSGAKFYFLKGDLALLENAITQYALDQLVKKDFNYMLVPHLVKSGVATGTGFAPRTSEQSDEYFIEGDDLALIATAEIPLTGFHAGEIINEDQLPLKYAGYSACYRKEAGTYGKHTRGLFRVHQFNKLEMYIFCLPENSWQMHDELLKIEEELWQAIGIPYRVINIASGDLGAPAAKKYDIEYWSKADGEYRELTSCSNCTDFQTRNLNIRVRRKDGTVELLHSLNGTAVSLARSLVAIIEHYQTEDGKLKIPEVLKPYMSNRDVI